MENKEKIIEAFNTAGKPLKTGELAELSGVEKKEITKIIKELKTEGKIHSPKRCYYEPTKN